jgi:hypothetical protein
MDNSTSVLSEEMKKHDAAQVAMMEECLIVVDLEDNPIGVESKKTCKLTFRIHPNSSTRDFPRIKLQLMICDFHDSIFSIGILHRLVVQ